MLRNQVIVHSALGHLISASYYLIRSVTMVSYANFIMVLEPHVGMLSWVKRGKKRGLSVHSFVVQRRLRVFVCNE